MSVDEVADVGGQPPESRIAELEAELLRLHSWSGLMSLLDEHWPEDLVPTLADDPARDAGSRIISLIRWVDRLTQRASAPPSALPSDTD